MPCSEKLKNTSGGQGEGGQDDLSLDVASMSTLHIPLLSVPAIPSVLLLSKHTASPPLHLDHALFQWLRRGETTTQP